MKVDDNMESVTCRICGEQCKRIYGKHLKYSHNNMTTNEYKKLYPNAPIAAISDSVSTSKNSGKHMKDDKYKKMFSEKIKGDKNPNHKSKTTEEVRKSRSPFSKDFIKYDGIQNIEEHISSFVKESIKDRVSDTTLKYYLDRGYTEEESKSMLSERQRTFTLGKCIQKYGEKEGIIKFSERQIKWQNSLNSNGNLKMGYSSISQILFDEIRSRININCRYATFNGEFSIEKENGGVWIYDFLDIDSKRIIEYQGDEYHANPLKFKSDDRPHPFRKNITSSDIWKKDQMKRETAEKNGYEVLYIWDSEYNSVSIDRRNEIVKRCISFIEKKEHLK